MNLIKNLWQRFRWRFLLRRLIGQGSGGRRVAVSYYTAGSAIIPLETLIELFGREPHPEIPLCAFEAEVICRPGEAVIAVFRCHPSQELFEKLGPALAAEDAKLFSKFGGFRKFHRDGKEIDYTAEVA